MQNMGCYIYLYCTQELILVEEVWYGGMGKECLIKTAFNREIETWDPLEDRGTV